jgi:hypothetical protein
VPWSFATVGDGHDAAWWLEFTAMVKDTRANAIAIEHEDPDVPPEEGVPAAARILSPTLEVAA